MRRLLPALLGLALAVPATAQSQFADSTGYYASVDAVPIAYLGNGSGVRLGTGVEIGRRFGNGFDAGLRASYLTNEARATSWSAGATAGLSRPAPFGTVARLQAAASYSEVSYDYTGFQYSSTGLAGDVAATVGRSFPLVGSLRVRPTVGVFGTAYRTLSADASVELRPQDETRFDAGVQIELPLTFRLFGTDAAVVGQYRISPRSGSPLLREGAFPGGGFRLNF